MIAIAAKTINEVPFKGIYLDGAKPMMIRNFNARLMRENYKNKYTVLLEYDLNDDVYSLLKNYRAFNLEPVLFGRRLINDGLPPALANMVEKWLEADGKPSERRYITCALEELEALQILNLDANAAGDLHRIKRAYRTLSLTHHPDKGGSKEAFERLTIAYNFLLNRA